MTNAKIIHKRKAVKYLAFDIFFPAFPFTKQQIYESTGM